MPKGGGPDKFYGVQRTPIPAPPPLWENFFIRPCIPESGWYITVSNSEMK